MSNRYSKQHYEDIAKALKENRTWAIQMDSSHARGVMASTIGTFADLFAADNPPTCIACGHRQSEPGPTCFPSTERTGHKHEGGFDRERFLAACGLEPEPRVPRPGLDADGNVPKPPECPNCGQTTHTIGECV